MNHSLSSELQIGKAGEHLVCMDLILQGHNAFLADQGLPYDVVMDDGNKLWKIHVRTTITFSNPHGCSIYRFQNRQGRAGKNRKASKNVVDFYAFVALDIKSIAYISSEDILDKNGCILQTVDFKSRLVNYTFTPRIRDEYVPTPRGRFLQDYSKFTCKSPQVP